MAGLLRCLPWLALHGVPLFVVMIAGVRALMASLPRRTFGWWFGSVILVYGFLVTVGFMVHFRVLGRHCAPMFPPLLFIVGSGVSALIGRDAWTSRAVVFLLLGTSLASCLMLRFSPVHAKEDYRQAAKIASEALKRKQVVWWSAAGPAANAYGVSLFRSEPIEGRAFWANDISDKVVGRIPTPDLILISKPDTFDRFGAVRRYVYEHGYSPVREFTGFTVWQRQRN
jgi:hypothetical protein